MILHQLTIHDLQKLYKGYETSDGSVLYNSLAAAKALECGLSERYSFDASEFYAYSTFPNRHVTEIAPPRLIASFGTGVGYPHSALLRSCVETFRERTR